VGVKLEFFQGFERNFRLFSSRKVLNLFATN
jgi:hypothetical protein